MQNVGEVEAYQRELVSNSDTVHPLTRHRMRIIEGGRFRVVRRQNGGERTVDTVPMTKATVTSACPNFS
jgi:hypothetical protein